MAPRIVDDLAAPDMLRKTLAAMGFKKPFRAAPLVLGNYARTQHARGRRSTAMRTARRAALLALLVFIGGMVVSHWPALRAALPVYYAYCAAARMAGAAPIDRGSPGYRPELDDDQDGIACEPFAPTS